MSAEMMNDESSDAHDERNELPESIPLGEILCDPRSNIIRGGRCDGPNHPKVKEIVESVRQCGHFLECLGVRLLNAPMARPCGLGPCCTPESTGEHWYQLVYGYRRFIAAQVLGRTELSLKDAEVKLVEASDSEAEDMNVIENMVRGDPSEYELALAFIGLEVRRKFSPKQISELVHCTPYYAESLIRIAKRCPVDLLERWHLSPTKDFRRALDRVSKYDPHEKMRENERHEAMRVLFEDLLAAEEARRTENRAKSEAARATGMPSGRGTGGRGPWRDWSQVRTRIDSASEIYDSSAQAWRTLTVAERGALGQLIEHLRNPKTQFPFR